MAVVNAGIDEKLCDYLSRSLKDTLYYQLLGLELVRLGPGLSEFEVVTAEKHCNPLGLVHGGLIISLADAVMGNAVRSLGITGVTVDISASVITSVPLGSKLRGTGKVVRAGKNMIFAEAEIWCDDRIVSDARGTLFNRGPINYK